MTIAALLSRLRAVPQWIWLALLAALGIAMMQRRAYSEGRENATEAIEDQIEDATHQAKTRADEAEDRVTRDLNSGQLDRLRKWADASPLVSRPNLPEMGDGTDQA